MIYNAYKGSECLFVICISCRIPAEKSGRDFCLKGPKMDFNYDAEKWRRKREAVLRRDKYQCQMCRRYGRITAATTVHHIQHVEDRPDLTYEDDNLISVCDACHNKLHPEKAKRAEERGGSRPIREKARYYIPREMEEAAGQQGAVILVCGLPSTGKSTYVRDHMGDGIAYDLDHIAAAFRLRGPHEEYHSASRSMANDLLPGFIRAAGRYSDIVYIVRTAPTEKELEMIKPKKAVICTKEFDSGRDYPGINREKTRERLKQAVRWCRMNGVEIIYPPRSCSS